MPQIVTDPDLINELNGSDPTAAAAPAPTIAAPAPSAGRVTDPGLLAELNGPDAGPGVSFATQPDGSPAGLRNVPTAKDDPIYHGAVPIAQAPDQGASTAFSSGVGGVPIVGPAIERGVQDLAAYARSWRDGTSYDAEQQHAQDMTDIARQQHPGAALAGDVTGAALATAPVIAAAPEVFGAGPGGLTAGKVIAGGLSGAGIGATDAAVRSDGDPNAIVKGAVAGTVGGAAGPAIGAGLGRLGQGVASVYGRLASPSPGVSKPVADIISNQLANDGQLGPQGLASIGAAGPRAMLVDASPNLAGVLDGALQRGGPGAAAARQAIEARAAGAGQDMNAALDQAFGPPQGVQTATDALRDGSAAARHAAYEGPNGAYNTPIDYSTEAGRAVEDMMNNRVPPGIIARAQNQMRVDGALPPQQTMASIADDGTVTYHQMPDVRMVDYVTRSLNDVAYAGDGRGALGGNTAEGRSYGQLARDLRGALRSAVPEYGTALDTAAQPIDAKNALEFGASMMSPTVPRDAVAGTVQGMTAPELAQVRQGVRSHIADTLANVQRTVTDPNVDARQATAAVKMLSSDAATEKLGMLLGPDEQASISTALDHAGRTLDLRASLARNSATAARQNANVTVQQAAQPGMIKQALTAGGPLKATRPILQTVLGIRPEDIAARETGIQGNLASALTSPAPGAGSSIFDRLLQAHNVRSGANAFAAGIPYTPLAQTGILSLLASAQQPRAQ